MNSTDTNAVRLNGILADERFLAQIERRKRDPQTAAIGDFDGIPDVSLSDPESLNLIGAAASRLADYDLAAAFFLKAIELNPSEPIYYSNLAAVYQLQGKLDAAFDYCQKGLSAVPQNAACLVSLANVLIRLGRNRDAADVFRRAVELGSATAETHCALATTLMELGELDESQRHFEKALQLKPVFPEALNNFGLLQTKRGRNAAAEALYRSAIEANPAAPEFHSNLGDLLRLEKRLEESERACAEALRLSADSPSANLNMGNALREQSRFAAAEGYYEKALRMRPNYPEALNNLGSLMYDLGRTNEAVKHLYTATTLRPDYVDAHVNLAMALLLAGRFREGWPEYAWRWRQPRNLADAARFTKPLWDGGPIGERTLLIHAEQGVGDVLQFCRYVPYLAAGHRVVFEAPGSLTGLLSTLEGDAVLVAQGDRLPDFDLHCPLFDLPRIFGTVVQTIPKPVPYLKVDAEREERWRRRLAGSRGLNVGLAWAGNREMGADSRRSIDVGLLSTLGRVDGVNFLSLQKDRSDDIATALPGISDWTDELSDWRDTAALVNALDLVISVDTAVAHLAGALGKPIWLLNRFDRCWRWLLGREDSPWYPTLRQFRQPQPADWDSVLRAVCDALNQVKNASKSTSELFVG